MPLDERAAAVCTSGVAAQGRSLKVVLLRTYLALLGGGAEGLGRGRRREERRATRPIPYMTLVGYFNSLRELGGSRRIVEDEVASRVSRLRASSGAWARPTGSFADRHDRARGRAS